MPCRAVPCRCAAPKLRLLTERPGPALPCPAGLAICVKCIPAELFAFKSAMKTLLGLPPPLRPGAEPFMAL